MSFHHTGSEPGSPEGQEQMRQDADLISHPNRWAGDVLHLKSQPWKSQELGDVIFATMHAKVPLTVFEKGREVSRTYPALNALVLDWSVD